MPHTRRLLLHARDALAHLRGRRLALAVSGGRDSVVLMDVACALREELELALVVAHVDHGLRGAAAAEDARFVARLAAGRGLPFYRVRFHGLEGRGLEEAARRARMAFLRGVPAHGVLLAHHQDDQAETVLLRLLRSSGPELLQGMSVAAPPFHRPFLGVPRAWLEAWASARGLSWREDESNSDLARERNLVRARVMPLLDSVHGGVRERLAALADELAEVADAARLEAWERRCLERDVLSRDELAGLHRAQRLRAIRLHLDRRMGPGHRTPRARLLQALELVERGRPGAWVALSWGWRLASDGARLLCLPPPPPPRELRLRLPGVRLWGLHTVTIARTLGDREPLLIRPPRAGERFGGQPLREWLRRRGVPAPLRAYHPVFSVNERVVWIPGGSPLEASVPVRGLAIGVTASIPSAYAPGRPWSATL